MKVMKLTLFFSAARKFEQKVAKFLKTPKDLHQSNFKISKDLHQRPPQNVYIKALKIKLKTGLNRFFHNFPKVPQKFAKLPSRQSKILVAKWFKK